MADHLATQGFGILGKDLFTAQFHQNSDLSKVCVLITPSAGLSPSCALDKPRLQVISRCRDSVIAWEKASDIHDHLKLLGKVNLGDNLLVTCRAIQTPFPLGLDENKCWLFACNYQLELA